MAWKGLNEFVSALEKKGELKRIKTFFDPELEITEVADRLVKNGGPALLFENNGTEFPILINAFASEKRMALACNQENIEGLALKISEVFSSLMDAPASFKDKIAGLPALFDLLRLMPLKSGRKGICQHKILRKPDLGKLPVMKCWPYDGGRFITLPVVNTYHPETRKPNAGMYRMQVLDSVTTAMHWQLHKTGANHYEAWKKAGRIMPVSVVLGGDPVYTYAATAPLPENIDEFILAGFIRGSRVRLVKCVTNDIYVPEDADFVIEGFVDPSEEPVVEGPFGDHTGFYSLEGLYPKFHVTCITHSKNPVYPATIVGIPPMEDCSFADITSRIFLSPIRLTLIPEIEDMHLPEPGVAHNLAIVKINKRWPGQGRKVINSVFGAGQLMFTKFLVVVNGETDIRDYSSLAAAVFSNCNPLTDLIINLGPLDVLDHSSDTEAFGGKAGIDATVKMPQEITGKNFNTAPFPDLLAGILAGAGIISDFRNLSDVYGIPVLIITVKTTGGILDVNKIIGLLRDSLSDPCFGVIIATDEGIDPADIYTCAWYVLGNTDPVRDIYNITGTLFLIDGTTKAYRPGGFSRPWPSIVCAGESTIRAIDEKWTELECGELLESPSLKFLNTALNSNSSRKSGLPDSKV